MGESTVRTVTARDLTSGRVLAHNTLWNLAASAASILIALFSVPILLRYLGIDRFGVVSLVWIIEGQFGIFDLGLSQALTKLVAEKLGTSRNKDIPPIFWSSLMIMAGMGVIGAVTLYTVSPWLVHSILKVPSTVQGETLTAFHLVAISLPAVISTAALRGLLAAYQRFDLLSLVRIPISFFSYLAPLVVLPFSRKLGPFIAVLVFSRLLSWMIHLILCLRAAPVLGMNITTREAPLALMFSFGGWMTVTNLLSPIMVNVDRLLIGVLLSVSSVAYYATPYEVVTKLWIIPSAIVGVLFPAFATALAENRARAELLYEKGVKYIFLALFPIVLCFVLLGRMGLALWLGPSLAEHCAPILRLLAIGVFANSLAQVPFWQIQAANRPDLAAKVHVVELPCYLLLFWYLTTKYGIEGAGIAWAVRATIDAVVMFWLSGGLLSESKGFNRQLLKISALAALVFLVSFWMNGNVMAVLYLVVVSTLFAIGAWSQYLSPIERQLVRNPLRLIAKLETETH